MNDLQKARDKTIDICRFIGILLVVIGQYVLNYEYHIKE